MQYWDSNKNFIRTFKTENAVLYGVHGLIFRVNKECVKYLLYESAYNRYNLFSVTSQDMTSMPSCPAKSGSIADAISRLSMRR